MELMITLGIIAILAALAITDLRIFSAGRRLSFEGDQLLKTILRSRDLAMDQGYSWRILFNPGQGSWISYGDRNNDSVMDPGEKKLGPFTLGKGIRFGSREAKGPNDTAIPADGISIDDNCLTFSSLGCSNGGTIYVMNNDASIALRILTASGTVRVWQSRGSWSLVK